MAAAVELSNLNISLRALDTITDIFIYPLGRHGTNTYYTVCTLESKAILTVEVLEPGKQITVKNMEKASVLIGKLGLCDFGSRMTIHSPMNNGNKQIAFIDCLKLYDQTEVDHRLQVLMERSDHDPYLVRVAQKKDLLQPGNRLPNITDSTIKVNPRSSTTVVHYARLLTPLKRGILMMAALKLYYCMYKFNQHPIPRGIPSQMHPIPVQSPSLNMLHSCSEVKLRYSFRGKNDLYFLELFHGPTLELFLIAEATFKDGNTPMSVIFKDVLGVPQFHLHEQSPSCNIYDSYNDIIGIIIHNIYNGSNRLHYGSRQPVMEHRSHPLSPAFYLFFGLPESVGGSLSMNSFTNILEFRFPAELSVHVKAVAFADAVKTAIKIYNILSDAYHPSVNEYPYRKQVEEL